jgi:hypothetical protein
MGHWQFLPEKEASELFSLTVKSQAFIPPPSKAGTKAVSGTPIA